MLGFLGKLFSGGLISSVEKVALEAIDTPEEKAKASALWIKTLDPNGKMRRNLSTFACVAYGFYLVCTTILIFLHSFGVGVPAESLAAMEAMTDLFTPITTAWATMVSASFGVNGMNSFKGS